jgi:hypothetical protein
MGAIIFDVESTTTTVYCSILCTCISVRSCRVYVVTNTRPTIIMNKITTPRKTLFAKAPILLQKSEFQSEAKENVKCSETH